MKGYGKAVRDQLHEAGCTFARHGKGDHDVWLTPTGKRVIVPVKIMSRQGLRDDRGMTIVKPAWRPRAAAYAADNRRRPFKRL
jgi:hypothetical protein